MSEWWKINLRLTNATCTSSGSSRNSLCMVATSSVAFWLLATPCAFLASQKYTPESVSRRFRCCTDKKKRSPEGKTIWWPGSIVNASPFLNHLISGVGEPLASHFNVNGLFRFSTLLMGCSIIVGASRPIGWENDATAVSASAAAKGRSNNDAKKEKRKKLH